MLIDLTLTFVVLKAARKKLGSPPSREFYFSLSGGGATGLLEIPHYGPVQADFAKIFHSHFI